jgi:hypothetical protein
MRADFVVAQLALPYQEYARQALPLRYEKIEKIPVL